MNSATVRFLAMDIAQIRRGNLARLIAEYGSIEVLATACGKSASYLSQIKNAANGRAMGTRFARDMERSLSLPAGWFDQAPGAEPISGLPVPTEIALFRRLNRRQRDAITLILKDLARSSDR